MCGSPCLPPILGTGLSSENHTSFSLTGILRHHPTNRVSGISVTGIGFAQMERMERIFYRGFMYYLVPSSNFSDAREATIRAARELYGAGGVEEQTVRAGWNAVGVQ